MDSERSAPLEPVLGKLEQVLELLTEFVHVNPSRENLVRPVSGAVLYDQLEDAGSWSGAVVLGVGVSPASVDLPTIALQAERNAAAALVLKARGMTIDEIAQIVAPYEVAVLIVRDDTDWGHLASMVRASVEGTKADSVSGVRLGDIYALANAIASITNGATSIVDPVGRILGYSTLLGQPIDDLRRATTLALQEITPPAYDPDFATVYAAQHAIRIPDSVGGLDRYAIAVRAGDELLATIWTIDPGEGKREEVLDALDRLAPLAGLHLLHARSGADFGQRRNGDLMRTILEGGPHAPFAAAQLGVDTSRETSVAVFGFARPDERGLDAVREQHRLLNLVSIYCDLHFVRGHSALVDSRVYALFPSTGTDQRTAHAQIATVICEAARAVSSSPVLAAVGRPVDSVEDLPLSQTEAVRTLDLIAALPAGEGPSVALFEQFRAQLGVKELGDYLRGAPSPDDSDLVRVRDYDLENQTNYLDTLKAYLRANGNVAETSAALHIHNNTARYRIHRLTSEFGFALDDPDERLWIWLRLAAGFPSNDTGKRKPNTATPDRS